MHLSHSRKRALCWLHAFWMTTALFGVVLLKLNVRFATFDDTPILHAFLGYESGVPAHFNIYVHGLLAWPLYWLSCAFPQIAWFGWMQMALLYIACLVIVKSLLQCFVKHDWPIWLGITFAALFLLVLALDYVTVLSFTLTAALLGAAAVLQMFSIEHDQPRRVIIGMAGSLALLALAYALRQVTALPILAFLGLAFLCIFAEEYGLGKAAKRCIRPLVISLVMVAAVLAVLIGWRAWEVQTSSAQEYLAWQDANAEIYDYYGLGSVPDEAFDLVGWDDATIAMAQQWCFLDSELSIDAFETLTDYMHTHDASTLMDRLQSAMHTLRTLVTKYRLYVRTFALPFCIGALACIGACFKRKGRFLLLLSLLGCAAMLGGLLFYLAYAGRLPIRAALMAVLPASAFLFARLPAGMPHRRSGRSLLAVTLALSIAITGWCMGDLLRDVRKDPYASKAPSAIESLEAYALKHPDTLFIYDSTVISSDIRPFPTYPDGVPTNITYWGGWGLRSPESIAQFARYGIDLMQLNPSDLLKKNVCLASAWNEPPALLLRWLRQKVDPAVQLELTATYETIFIFSYTRP